MSVKKLTLTDLIKNKEQYQVKADTKEELYIERLGASITIRKPERSLCLEAFQMARDDKQADKADPYMVYNVIVEPNLKDSKLQTEFGCVEPTDIVEKLFESGEIAQIAGTAMKLAGYNTEIKAVADLKN